MLDLILTHPGGAHKDDLLACAVLAHLHPAPIERRDPTPDDVASPRTAIVDVGGSHDPSRMNFDHHHFPREHPPTCALSLVLQHLDLYEDGKRFFDWVETAEWFDSRGPVRTAEWLGAPRSTVTRLGSPVDTALLRRFSDARRIEVDAPLHGFLRMVGEDIVVGIREARSRLDRVAAVAQRWDLQVGDDTLGVIFLPREDTPMPEPSASVEAYIRAEQLGDEIVAIVYPDRRGPGYGISRYEDHPRLDFCRVQHEPDVHFAHKSGFVCKTTATAPARLQQLVRGGWRTS